MVETNALAEALDELINAKIEEHFKRIDPKYKMVCSKCGCNWMDVVFGGNGSEEEKGRIDYTCKRCRHLMSYEQA